MPLIVIKKDGKREVFNRQKLINGILHACETTKVSYSQVENLVSEIESSMHNRLDKEISSTEIGELVMAKLKVVDDVAYVRFASVYREFKDVNTFLEELNRILRK